MTDLDVQEAKADNMINPSFLAASMIEERAPDIVEALTNMPSELAVAVLLTYRPTALQVLDQPGLEREPELVTLMPRRPSRPSDHRQPLMDREDVARLISKYDLLAVPVVDHCRVIGIVTVDDVIDAIVAESTEDAQKFDGMEGHQRAVHGNRLPANDEQARRLAVCAVPVRNAGRGQATFALTRSCQSGV